MLLRRRNRSMLNPQPRPMVMVWPRSNSLSFIDLVVSVIAFYEKVIKVKADVATFLS